MGIFFEDGSPKRNVLLLLQGHFISKIGSAAFDIVFVLWMKQQIGLAGVIGIVMMLAKLPEICLSPLSGTLVDMASRKKVLVVCDLVIGIIITAISAICLTLPVRVTLHFAMLIAGAICIGICDSFFNPAVASFLPELVARRHLQSVNSVYRFTTTAAGFLGQFAAAALFTVIGAPVLFLFNGVSYLFSAGSQACIAPPVKNPTAGRSDHPFRRVLANLKEGMAFIGDDQGLKGFLLILCLYHFFLSPFTVILPFYVTDVLNAAAAWYGYAMGCFGVGLLVGFILAGVLRLSGPGRARLVVACFGVSATAFSLIGVLHHLCLVLPLIFVIGVTIAIIVVMLNTIIVSFRQTCVKRFC